MVEEDADDRAKNNPRTNRELKEEDIRLGHEDKGQEQGNEDTTTGEGEAHGVAGYSKTSRDIARDLPPT